MQYLSLLMSILTIVFFAVAMALMPIAWIRIAKNMFIVLRHVNPKVIDEAPLVRINRFNAMCVADGLDEKGKVAKDEVHKNKFLFVVPAVVTLVLAELSGGA